MPPEPNSLREIRDDLFEAYKRASKAKLDTASRKVLQGTAKDLMGAIDRATAVLDALGAQGDGHGLEPFFETVAEGVVSAQRDLDVRSSRYLAGEPTVPAIYRIPKVEAELFFKATEREEGGFFAQIFSGDMTEKTLQHRVKFDIVATPPPPEVVQQLGMRWLSSFIVTDLRTREVLKSRLEAFVADDEQPNTARLRAGRFVEHIDRTFVFQGASAFVLCLFLQKDEQVPSSGKDVLTDMVVVSDAGVDVPQPHMAIVSRSKKVNFLADQMFGVAKLQEDRLRQLRADRLAAADDEP